MNHWLLPVLQCSFQGALLQLQSEDLLLCRVQSVVGVVQDGINSGKQAPDVVQRSFIGWSRSDVSFGFPTGSERCVPTVGILQPVRLFVGEHIKHLSELPLLCQHP
jgi:hypothetical protein